MYHSHLSEKFKTSPNKTEMYLFFMQSKGSAGTDDSSFGPKQGGGDSEKR